MVVQHVTCDRCGGRIEKDRTKLDVASGPLRDRIGHVDLCAGCAVEMVKWLAASYKVTRVDS